MPPAKNPTLILFTVLAPTQKIAPTTKQHRPHRFSSKSEPSEHVLWPFFVFGKGWQTSSKLNFFAGSRGGGLPGKRHVFPHKNPQHSHNTSTRTNRRRLGSDSNQIRPSAIPRREEADLGGSGAARLAGGPIGHLTDRRWRRWAEGVVNLADGRLDHSC